MRWIGALVMLVVGGCTGGDDGPWELSSHTLQACSGTIAVQTWTRPDAVATFAFVNGFTEYTDKYHHIIDLLGDRSWNIVMWDHYGQGRSDGIRAHADSFEDQHVCDMGAVLDAFADDNLPIGVVAHSMGGQITARFIELHPGELTGVVLSSAYLRLIPPDGYTTASACGLAIGAAAGDNAEEPYTDPTPRARCEENIVTHDCEQYNLFVDDPITLIGPPTWGWLADGCRQHTAILEDAFRVTEDVLILQAGDDLIQDNAGQDALCAAIEDQATGSCEIAPWPGLYHELFNEVERAEVMDRALTHLDPRLGP